ncbi:head protein [Agrobacterium tumefaciens]|uniref:SU10 major capsid protein n=1 Tax=Agrobacterium TaxID=357 RepID=UPI00115D2BB8|nr:MULTISPECIES: DUF5309 family protein [Agrobacterium]MDA5241137.1 DUF5309 domain-containing protein [Agrobacterium sp. MAFF310724]MDA5249572.1 DUF5309 domain-containing protein [Agrobacterium sp. MAFF210268]TRB12365.1 head protein [Agrobacterium tumefaciens]
MAVLKSTEVKNGREDLGDVISNISPTKTPFFTEIKKDKATNTYHEFLNDKLEPANKDNAQPEAGAAPEANQSGPNRLGNYTQIFSEVAEVSGTLEDGVNSAGYKSAMAYQIAKKTEKLKIDIESALVSANASVGGNTRKLGGLEAWLSTNADHGVGGSTPGFNAGLVGAVTAGTTRPLTEDMFNELAQSIWEEGGDPSKVIVSGSLKRAFSKFSGNATKYQEQDKSKTVYAGVEIYVSDFGTHHIIPHHFMSKTTVIAFDPAYWSVSTARPTKKTELGRVGDSVKCQILTELTLSAKNEASSGKIADVTAV